ncbi:MAG: hypothetical protein KKF12_03335 [Proteobacteria bacterium]|nr:hypothetical protein [Desulfobacula sp.]MBU3952507.1 hypothetical protein [Pseudomonadota bacterium]MBU4129832.1 hypothetical protein [Pseudomonadota bacterium]
MPKQIQVHPKFERQLAVLERQGTTRSIAAQRARRIIEALTQGDSPASAGLLKKKTDRRVKNCLKFDLGAGFRLICIIERKIIYVLFVGDHDSSDNWLDNYSKKKPHKTELEMNIYSVDNQCAQISGTPAPMEDVFENPGFSQVTQKELRRVFKGLVG